MTVPKTRHSGRADAAIKAMAEGWHVFPCHPGGKAPWCRNGVKDATNDPSGVEAHWAHFPDHNVGIACGPSSLVVIDCDQPKDGWTWPTNWAKRSGLNDGLDVIAYGAELAGCPIRRPFGMFDTRYVRTPSGGWHFYFAAPAGMNIRNSAGLLGPLVDVRADGGYVLAAGSEVAGRPYELVHRAPVAPLPAWLALLLEKLTVRQQAAQPTGLNPHPYGRGLAPGTVADRMLEEMATAADGERHDVFTSRIFRFALDEARGLLRLADYEPTIRDIGRAQGRTERELDAMFSSARDKARGAA